MNKFIYVFVRADLPSTQIVVQSIHSVFELGKRLGADEEGAQVPPSVVLVRAKDEKELKDQLSYVRSLNFNVEEFIEPYYDHSLTSFAAGLIEEQHKVFFKKFKLLRHEHL